MAKGKSLKAQPADATEVAAPDASPGKKLPVGKLAMTRDPRVYEQRLPMLLLPYKRLVGLDLASSCGVTFCDIIPGQVIKDAPLIGGQWNLSVGPYDTNSLRYVRLKQFLAVTAPDLIFYEEVKFTGQSPPPGTAKLNLRALVARAVSGAQVVHGLAAILTTWAEERDIPCQAVPIKTLKQYGAGKGNASKEDMIKACNGKIGTEFGVEDYQHTGADNIADSMFLCDMAVQQYSEGL